MSILLKLSKCDIYVALWMTYYLQGIVYPQGSINHVIQFAVFVWSSFIAIGYLFKFNSNPSALKTVSLLLLMFSIYGLEYIISGTNYMYEWGGYPASYRYLTDSFVSLLPIFVFYHFAKHGLLTVPKVKLYLILLIGVTVLRFRYNYTLLFNMNEWGQTEFTNNVGYNFLALFPMVCFFYKKPLIQYLLSAFILAFILASMKRGAILIGSLCFIYFLYQNIKNAHTTKQRTITLSLTIALVAGVIYKLQQMLSESSYFIRRFELTMEGDSTGRDASISNVWNHFLNNNSAINQIFGNGANYTIVVEGNYAHNDWAEILCNNGIVGVIMFASFFIGLLKMSKLSHKISTRPYATCMTMLLVIIFVKSLFSMSIQSLDVSISMLLGLFCYQLYRNARVNAEIYKAF